jgi:hypothetical protein
MNQEIIHIYQIIKEGSEPLTTAQISKELYSRNGLKISKKIVQNYLWSYFRDIIDYNSNDFTYKIKKSNSFEWSSVELIKCDKLTRAIEPSVNGNILEIKYNCSISKETIIKAIVEVYFNMNHKKKNVDFLKLINQAIDNL